MGKRRGKVIKISPNPYNKVKGTQSAQLHCKGRQGERTTHAKNSCPDELTEDAQMKMKKNRECSGFHRNGDEKPRGLGREMMANSKIK